MPSSSFFKYYRRRIILLILFGAIVLLLFAVFLAMKLAWKMSPSEAIDIAYLDKTDTSKERLAHSAFYWVIDNQRIVKKDSRLYQKDADYWGVFTEENGVLRFNDFDEFSDGELNALSEKLDVLMFADTYGIYLSDKESGQTKLVYGGLSLKDVSLFRKMKEKKKTIIAEFNILQPPTPRNVRYQFQEEAAIHWTGWSGKYFESLSRQNEKLPAWVIRLYQASRSEDWDFRGAGIVLVHEDGRLVVLSGKDDLTAAMPQIKTFGYGINELELPALQRFGHWFDIMEYNDSINHAVSAYQLNLTSTGESKLKQHGIPDRFPAIIMHHEQDYRFYYLCGDFSSNPVSMATSRFRGIEYFASFLKGRRGIYGEDDFFYRFYLPLMRNVLRDTN